jgi:hypothetical protein
MAAKKSNPKAKPVHGEFSSQEVTASIFSYTPDEFKKLKLKTELKNWQEDLESNSASYPTYVGSPFDKNYLNLEAEYEESEFDEEMVYVIPHYFYESAEYAIDREINSSHSIMLAPIVGKLLPSMPMDFAQNDVDRIGFEGLGASNGSYPEVAFYFGSRLITSCLLKDVDVGVFKEVVSAL